MSKRSAWVYKRRCWNKITCLVISNTPNQINEKYAFMYATVTSRIEPMVERVKKCVLAYSSEKQIQIITLPVQLYSSYPNKNL